MGGLTYAALGLSWVTAIASLLPAGRAQADDVFLDAETSFQAYEVRSPGTTVLMARRRFVQSLSLRYVTELGGTQNQDEPRRRSAPLVITDVQLRLDHDFGETCLLARELCLVATDPREPAAYQPLATDTLVDAPSAHLEVTRLPLGGRVRAGRHLVHDGAGLLRLDGGSGRIEPAGWLALEAFGGALVRSSSIAGADGFLPQGSLRAEINGLPRERVPFVDPPITTWAVGGAVEAGQREVLIARLGARDLFEGPRTVARRLGLALASEPAELLHLSAAAQLDPVAIDVVDAVAAVAMRSDPLEARVAIERHVPTFDLGTIWAYFVSAPLTEVSLTSTYRLSARSRAGASLHHRRAAGAVTEAAGATGEDATDTGGGAHFDTRVAGIRLYFDGAVWGGTLSPLASVSARAQRQLGPNFDSALALSAWHFDDPLRDGLYGTSLAENLSLRYRISKMTKVGFELDHAHSRGVGHRFRGLLWLSFEVWR